MVRTAAQPIGRTVVAPWQLRSCMGFWLPEPEYTIRDGSNRVSFMNSLVPKPRRIAFEQGVSTARPAWNASNPAFNGRPTLGFDGSNTYMLANALASVAAGDSAPITVMAVCSFDGVTGTTERICAWRNSSNGSPIFAIGRDPDSSGGAYTVFRRNDAGTSGGASTSTGTEPATVSLHSILYDGSNVTWYRNRVVVAGINNDTRNDQPLTLDRFALGALYNTAPAQVLGGLVGAFALYGGDLADSERRIAEWWLMRRFNL